MSVADDGTVTYTYERLEISLRPMTDEELNRQFVHASKGGIESTNPYTYGDWIPRGEEGTPPRFTVFLLTVKNYTFPKILVDPSNVLITAQNGRTYSPLSFQYLKEYYVSFVLGYAGNATQRYEERKDILLRTLFPRDESLFSGRSQRGYIVFPVLHEDVREITVELRDIILRFDSLGRPVEKLNVTYRFRREVEVIRPGSQKASSDYSISDFGFLPFCDPQFTIHHREGRELKAHGTISDFGIPDDTNEPTDHTDPSVVIRVYQSYQ